MKKLLAVLICLGLISNSVIAISPLRAWKCRPSNPQPGCSQAEKDAAKNFFKTATAATLGTLAAVLAAFGITVGAYQLSKEKEAATKPSEAERMREAGRQMRELQEELGQQPTQKELLEGPVRGKLIETAEEAEARIRKIRGY